MDTLTLWLDHYGAFGLFVLMALGVFGVPIPEETTLTLTGYLVYRGHIQLGAAIAAAAFGSMIGISTSYILGRTLGLRMVTRYGKYVRLSPERIEKAHQWFERIGHWGLFFGYFMPGVRHLTAIAAGTTKLRYLDFAVFAYAGALVWTFLFITLGVFVGHKWRSLAESIQRHMLIGTLVIIAIIGIVLLVRWLIRRHLEATQ